MPIPVARLIKRRISRVFVALALGAILLFYAFPSTHPGHLGEYFTSGPVAQRSSLILDPNGLAYNWTIGERIHPIEELMERGRKRWERLIRRQSKTLEQAVQTYKDRYGRNPPKGFDTWWKWARENDVKIVDDYDQIHIDTNLYWAISPQSFRDRVKAIQQQDSSFMIHIDPKGPAWADGNNPNWRSDMLLDLLEPVSRIFPEELMFVVSVHDLGSMILGNDQKVFLEDKIAKGEYATPEELKPMEWTGRYNSIGLPGLASACPEDSPAWIQTKERFDREGPKPKGPRPLHTAKDKDHPMFIHDHRPTYDYCYHPDNIIWHGGLSWDAARAPALRPMFQQSKFARNGEFVLTPLDYYYNASEQGHQDQYLMWEEKDIAKLHWRGKPTGDSYSHRDDFNWRNSHRVRLHTLTHEKEGQTDIYVKGRRTGGWEWQTWDTEKVNKAYTDVGLTDGPMQCNKEDGTCDEMQEQIDWSPRVSPQQAGRYKYAIDVDGNGWSSRFHRLLLSGSCILKSTIYPEFYTDWIIPWYHYVPLQPSYAELYTVLSFFIGAPGSPSTGHDELAQEIAENGRKFALEHWRWEDMQSYMIRLLLEYIRLSKDDREAWSYTGPTSDREV